MRILLDTNALVWWMQGNERLGVTATRLLKSESEVVVSAVSIWEWHIKARIRKIAAVPDLLDLINQQSFLNLDFSVYDAQAVSELPELDWKDPFDLGLMAQARENGLPLLTSDRRILDAMVPGLITIDARR